MSPGSEEHKIQVMKENRRNAWLYMLRPLLNVALGLVSGNKNQSKLYFDGHCHHHLQGHLQIKVHHRPTWWKHTAALKEQMTSSIEIVCPQNFMLHDLKNGKTAVMITPLLEIYTAIYWTTTKDLAKSPINTRTVLDPQILPLSGINYRNHTSLLTSGNLQHKYR